MASTENQVTASGLWWFDRAWNEDSLDWFLSKEEENPGAGTDILRVIFDQLQPSFPASAPNADWLSRFYLALGDPKVEDTGAFSNFSEPTGTSNFIYDPNDDVLSLPMQLVDYYLHFSGCKTRFEMLHQPQISERLAQLLTTIEFTPQEWEWLINKLEPESLGVFGGLYHLVISNPVLPRLAPSASLTGLNPLEFIELQTLGAVKWLLEETLKASRNEVPAPSRTAVFDKLDVFVRSANARSNILETIVKVLSAAVPASLESHHQSTAKAGRPANTRTAEYSFCVNAAQLLLEIDAHPNYSGSTADFANSVFDELTLGDAQPTVALKPFHVLTGDITDPSHRYYVEPVAIAHATGLVPFEEGELYFSNNELVYMLYALVNFSKEEARKSFHNMILTSEVSERQLDGAGYLMPMFSDFFSELREAYGDPERNIPLAWLLEASKTPQGVPSND